MSASRCAAGTSTDRIAPRSVLGVSCLVLSLAMSGLTQRAEAIEGMLYLPQASGGSLQMSNQLPTSNLTSPFNIVLNFINAPTPVQAAAFTAAEATWESIILGYQEDVFAPTVTIDVRLENIDGPGMILGSAGPDTGKGGTSTFLYTDSGTMRFDTSDLPSLGASLNDVILHEMGHVLGIGTLWSSAAVSVPGFQELYVGGSGQYTGAHGLAAYNAEFGQAGAFVPVELGGGGGTANSHWNEVDGGAGATGIVSNITNQDFAFELMTGWLNAPTFISGLTVQGMRDLGYNVVPEPTSFVLLLIGCVGLLPRRTRTA